MCFRHFSPFDSALELLDLSPVQMAVLKNRFMPLMYHLRTRTYRVSILFHAGRIIVTVGSLIVPALLSIQMNASYQQLNYWSTWTISLFVTICNALLTLFKLDKRYYYLNTCLEQLHSEGWQYIELSGKYSGFNMPSISPTHSNQFVYFCHAVEKIRMRQVEEEYFKMIDNNHPPPQQPIDSLVPPTPSKDEYKRMISQIPGAAPILDSPIVNAGATDKGPENTENNTYGQASSMSMQRILPSTGPDSIRVLPNTPGLQGGFIG